jgi:molybdopterin-guanine dinucleotide biosynthesis protein A
MMNNTNIEAFILAGGKSSRMGYDKGLLEVAGRPMIAHLLITLQSLGLKTTIVSSNAQYQLFGVQLVSDIIPEQGPMGGLLTALTYAQSPFVLLLSCDMPFVEASSLQLLCQHALENSITVSHIEGRNNPMPAIYPVSLKDSVQKAIDLQQLKISQWLFMQNTVEITLNETNRHGVSTYINLNSPDDINKLSY